MPNRAAPPAGAPRYKVSLAQVVAALRLEVVTDSGADLAERSVTTSEVNRPGLQWTGYLDHFSTDRLQIVGRAEAGYLSSLTEHERSQRLTNYCRAGFPAAILTRGLDVPKEAIATVQRAGIPVLRSTEPTSEFISWLNRFLSKELAPRTTIHAGLVDVAGVGVLILGQSGMGKSETTMELIRRGHRLIADDTVEVRRPSGTELWGISPALQRHFMEIKGIGIVNVMRMFGIGAVRMHCEVDLVVSLERWDPDAVYGTQGSYDILGVNVPLLVIPVEPGRNLAVIIEAAAMTQLAHDMGY